MAYRTTPARMDRAEQLRQRILDCALSRVAGGGFASLTMVGLADDVGIATGSLYRHFHSKGELAAEVFASASGREVDALRAVLRGDSDPAARLARGIRQFAARAWSSRSLAFALIAEPVEAEVDEQRLLYREAYGELFCELLVEGAAQGVFQVAQPRVIAACLVGAIAESLVGPLSPPAWAAREAGRLSIELAVVSDALTTFCLRAVGAKEPHP